MSWCVCGSESCCPGSVHSCRRPEGQGQMACFLIHSRDCGRILLLGLVDTQLLSVWAFPRASHNVAVGSVRANEGKGKRRVSRMGIIATESLMPASDSPCPVPMLCPWEAATQGERSARARVQGEGFLGTGPEATTSWVHSFSVDFFLLIKKYHDRIPKKDSCLNLTNLGARISRTIVSNSS